MKIEKIKPVPKYIVELIKRRDKKNNPTPTGKTRFYAYLTTNDKELVKVTVAVRHKYKKWHYKQCAVHGLNSENCFAKDILWTPIGGYVVGWFAEGLTKYPKWYEDEEWGEAGDKYLDPFAPIVNAEYVLKIPEFKYSACELYDGVNTLQYLRFYRKYPQMEYMVKLGLSKYAMSKQLLEKVSKDKKFYKWLSANREELKLGEFYITSILQAYQKNKPLKEVQAFESAKKNLCKEESFKPIREMLDGKYERYLNYIGKQQITNRLYLDYLKACNYLGLDMSEDKNRFPHDFNYWHDMRIDEYSTAKALKDEQERAELYEKFSIVSEKYSPMQYDEKNNLIVVIPKTPADLIREGEKLNHCVGRMNYDQKFIREETLIFFIRSPLKPTEPFVTVEYSIKQKKILQCYAKGNTKPNDTVMDYIKKIWLPYANKTLKKIVA